MSISSTSLRPAVVCWCVRRPVCLFVPPQDNLTVVTLLWPSCSQDMEAAYSCPLLSSNNRIDTHDVTSPMAGHLFSRTPCRAMFVTQYCGNWYMR